jgi:hypothetical protein
VIVQIIDSNPNDAVASNVFVDRLAILVDGAGSNPVPVVSVTALNPTVAEQATQPAQFQITRSGDLSAELTVDIGLAGSATDGVDYFTPTQPIVFPMDVAAVTVNILPIDDGDDEGNETVTLNLLPSANYNLGSSGSAIITIIDDESMSSEVFPISEQVVQGSIAQGSFADTFASDDIYEQLTESSSPGSSLTHIWRFDVPAGSTATLSLEAFTNSTTEVFWVNYSTPGGNWRNLQTINKTVDDDQAITQVIPVTVGGEVAIRIVDSNSSSADVFRDSVFVDELKLIIS